MFGEIFFDVPCLAVSGENFPRFIVIADMLLQSGNLFLTLVSKIMGTEILLKPSPVSVLYSAKYQTW